MREHCLPSLWLPPSALACATFVSCQEIGTSSECSAEGPGSCAAKEGVDSPPLLIKGGTVVNADREFKADVLIQGGIISKVGIDLPVCLYGKWPLALLA